MSAKAHDLVSRLRDEADLCRNETATDVAALLDEAADALDAQPAQAAQPVNKPAAWMRQGVCYREWNGRRDGEKIITEDKVFPTDIPLYAITQPVGVPDVFDFAAHLQRQRGWSGATFGPGARVQGVVDHIRKELKEIEADPGDLKEWIDVVILALDGAWRSGASPSEIIDALVSKQTKNEGRVWPDWRTADPNKAIEHDRSKDAAPQPSAGKLKA